THAKTTTRRTSSTSHCGVSGGDCGTTATPGQDDSVRANAQVDCPTAHCSGKGSATTGASARQVTSSWRNTPASTRTGRCSAHGAGGTCGADSDSGIEDRNQNTPSTPGVKKVVGPVPTSHASGNVSCTNASRCGGESSASTKALNTGVSKHWRGTSAS